VSPLGSKPTEILLITGVNIGSDCQYIKTSPTSVLSPSHVQEKKTRKTKTHLFTVSYFLEHTMPNLLNNGYESSACLPVYFSCCSCECDSVWPSSWVVIHAYSGWRPETPHTRVLTKPACCEEFTSVY